MFVLYGKPMLYTCFMCDRYLSLIFRKVYVSESLFLVGLNLQSPSRLNQRAFEGISRNNFNQSWTTGKMDQIQNVREKLTIQFLIYRCRPKSRLKSVADRLYSRYHADMDVK